MRWIIRSRVGNCTAEHGKSVVFGFFDLQQPEGFGDLIGDQFGFGGRFGFLDAIRDHRGRIRFGQDAGPHKGCPLL
jgi:hypothetical protein